MKTALQLLFLAAALFAAAIMAARLHNFKIGDDEKIVFLEVKDLKPPTDAPAVKPVSATTTASRPARAEQPPASAAPKQAAPEPEKPPPAAGIRPEAISRIIPEFTAPQLTDQEFYSRFSKSVIQIFCRTADSIFSASGVIVNGGGLVLTNAHVVEIVRQAGTENCDARHGNPADSFAGLEAVYAADAAAKITDTDVPQRDFGFLKLLQPREAFGWANPSAADAGRGMTLYTLGYPSEFLQSITASSHSNLVFSTLRVDDLGDIDGDRATAEAYVFRGGLVLQQGSSGTALFTGSGDVVGIIFATTKGATTAEREGFALTTSYIDRVLKLETGRSLTEFAASH